MAAPPGPARDPSIFAAGLPTLDPSVDAPPGALRRVRASLRRTATLRYRPRVRARLSRLRLVVQGGFLALFVGLFCATYHPLTRRAFLERLMQLDPLPWIATSLASGSWARGAGLALGMLAAGLLVGRFFCSMICPLGALIDLTDWALFRRVRRTAPYQWLNRWRSLKYWLLGYLLLAAALGHMHLHYLDPLSIAVRIGTLVAWPLASGLFALGFDSARGLAGAAGWQWLVNLHVYTPRLALDLMSVAMVAVVFGGQLLQSRFWCRNVCPVGALFGLLSRPAGVDGVVDTSCIDCKICVQTCTMNAIDLDPAVRFGAECIQCTTCVSVCPTQSITFVPRRRAGLLGLRGLANLGRRLIGRPIRQPRYVAPQPTLLAQVAALSPGAPPAPATPRISRRGLLRMGAVAAGTTAAAATLGIAPRARAAPVLRPPGSAGGDAFLELCIRCEACVKACTYDALVPMRLGEAGWGNLWTPRFEMRQSACDTTCNACGLVCPTGAIAPLGLPQKQRQVIGLAAVRADTCLLWHDEPCNVCVDACADAGYHAIEQFFADGFEKIRVLAERCTGCGWCEHHCPVGRTPGASPGPAAIEVEHGPARPALSWVPGAPVAAEAAPPGGGFDFDDEGLDEDAPPAGAGGR